MRALLISQDPDESAILSLVLQRAGLNVTRSRQIPPNLKEENHDPFRLFMLASPEGSPLGPVKALRAQTQAPLIVIGGHLDEATQVVLLESGADLVVLRPFSARLLIVQIRTLLRRAAELPFYSLPSLNIRDVELDPNTRTVVIEEHSPKHLTQLEFRLLYTLMIHKHQVVPQQKLIEEVWGYDGEGDRDLVRGLVRRLRIKVEPDPSDPQYIRTVPGVGYTFNPDI
jgi:DNA-binding response OmpR family regulator